jgi:PhzF family phenazine biosynthesis protein
LPRRQVIPRKSRGSWAFPSFPSFREPSRRLDASTVDKARPDAGKLLAVLRKAAAEGCYVYAFDTDAPDTAYARFFNPTVGLWEDAATGTAAGPLAAYLAAAGHLKSNELAIEQGTQWAAGVFCVSG